MEWEGRMVNKLPKQWKCQDLPLSCRYDWEQSMVCLASSAFGHFSVIQKTLRSLLTICFEPSGNKHASNLSMFGLVKCEGLHFQHTRVLGQQQARHQPWKRQPNRKHARVVFRTRQPRLLSAWLSTPGTVALQICFLMLFLSRKQTISQMPLTADRH